MMFPVYIGGQHVASVPARTIFSAAPRFLEGYDYDFSPEDLRTECRMDPAQTLYCQIDDLQFVVRLPEEMRASRSPNASLILGVLILSPIIIGVLMVAVPFLLGFFAWAIWMTAYDPVMQAEARAQYIDDETDACLTDVKPPRDRSYDEAIHRWWQTDCRWKGIRPQDAPPYVDFALWCDLVHKETGWFKIPIGVDVDEHDRVSVADVLRRLEVAR